MAFEKYVLCKKNEECTVENCLSKETYNLKEVVDLLNNLDHRYDELHDNLYKVFIKEYKTTRWKDEHGIAKRELILSMSKELGIEL